MIVAIDYGKKRCGYAYGEKFVKKNGVIPREKLINFLRDINPDRIVFGLPLSMSGRYSCQTFEVIEYAERVFKILNKEVFFMDERLSTKMAHMILKDTKGKTSVDAVSAALIFETFISNTKPPYKIKRELQLFRLDRMIKAKRVLIHNVEDVSVLEKIEAQDLDVLQSDPYIAYLFKKKVGFVERFERFLKGDYDVIITPHPDSLNELLSKNGRIIRARSSAG